MAFWIRDAVGIGLSWRTSSADSVLSVLSEDSFRSIPDRVCYHTGGNRTGQAGRRKRFFAGGECGRGNESVGNSDAVSRAEPAGFFRALRSGDGIRRAGGVREGDGAIPQVVRGESELFLCVFSRRSGAGQDGANRGSPPLL